MVQKLVMNREDLNKFELETGHISYKNLLKRLNIYDNMVLCNNIREYFDLQLIIDDNTSNSDIYQYFICDVAEYVIDLLKDCFAEQTDIVLYYCEELDVYVLGVTHFGTGWDAVLTSFEWK